MRVTIQPKSPAVKLLYWQEETALNTNWTCFSKILEVTCDFTVSSALSFRFLATPKAEQVAHTGEILSYQLWSLWSCLFCLYGANPPIATHRTKAENSCYLHSYQQEVSTKKGIPLN